MKKVKLVISAIIVFFLGISVSNAASLKVSANKSTVVVGSTVTVTVNASGAAGWEYCLSYDSSIFSLSSSTSDTGRNCVRTGSTLIGYSKVTFTLKAIKSGTSTITVKDEQMYGDDGNAISSTKNSIKLTTKTQAEIEASYSTDANLKNLSVSGYTLSPEFDKNTTTYSLEVENDVESITISATKSDSSATITGTGEKTLTEGINKFNIIVTAEKGNKKTYTIEVTRKELNPISVKVDNQEMTVVRKSDALEVPPYYSSTEVELDGEMIPALKSDITGYTLVGLKDGNGTINLYVYNDVNNTYLIYKQVGLEGFTFIPIASTSLINGYDSVKNIEVEGISMDSYTNGTDSSLVLIYGMNAKTGETGWYRYDTAEGTFQKYYEESISTSNKDGDLYFLLAIVFAGIAGLAILLLFVMMASNSKARKKNERLIEMVKASRMAKENEIKQESVKEKREEPKEEKVEEKKEVLNEAPKDAEIKKEKKEEPKKVVKDETKPKKEEKIEAPIKLEDSKENIPKKEKIEKKEEIDKSQLSQRELRRLEREKELQKEEKTPEVKETKSTSKRKRKQ